MPGPSEISVRYRIPALPCGVEPFRAHAVKDLGNTGGGPSDFLLKMGPKAPRHSDLLMHKRLEQPTHYLAPAVASVQIIGIAPMFTVNAPGTPRQRRRHRPL